MFVTFLAQKQDLFTSFQHVANATLMADAPDSKSGPRKRVWVQVPPSVLKRVQEENPLVAHSASGSGSTPVSTAMRSSSGQASQVA